MTTVPPASAPPQPATNDRSMVNANISQMHEEYSQTLLDIERERHVLQRFILDNPRLVGGIQDHNLAVYLIMNHLGCKATTVHRYFDDIAKLVQEAQKIATLTKSSDDVSTAQKPLVPLATAMASPQPQRTLW